MTEMILTSSVLILLVAVLRRALRGRISPVVQYALWLLVAARLLIPGTLFPAPVTVLGAAEGLQTTLHEAFPDPDDLPEPVINGIMDQASRPAQSALPPRTEFRDDDTVVTYQTIPPVVTQRVYNWPDILWKTGMAVMAGALVVSNLVFALRLRKNRKLLTLPDALWSGKLPVYAAEGIPSPCLFGLFRPAVYLNEAAMGAAHPEHILAHEYAHYRHGDHLWSILRGICLVIHWYNPLVWWAAALSRRDGELACDAAALRRLGEEARIDYGQTLLGMVSRSRNPAALLHTATTMTAGKRAMKERIALIVKQPKMRKITLVVVVIAACLLAVCTFGGKAEAEEPPGTREPSEVLETPAAVYLAEPLSPQYQGGPITDPDIVSRLWELYQGFTFNGTTEEFTRDNVWSVWVTFRDEAGQNMADFTIWAGGLCWLEDDYETFHVLRNGQAIYEEFRDCCRTVPRDETYTPNEPDVQNEALARLDALGGEKEAVYHFTSKLGAPANGTLTERDISALEEAFRACQWTRGENVPEADYIVWDIRDSSAELMGDHPYWEKVSVGGFTFYDGHPYVLYSDGDTTDWYYVPEGWVTVQAALFYAADTTLTLAEKKGLYLYEQARGEWNSFQFGRMYERYSGVSETEEGNLPCVGFFESVADFRGYLETMFSPEITEYLMNIPAFVEYGGRLRYLPADRASNIYAGEETYRAFPLSAEEAAQYGYDGHIFAQTPVLGQDLETVLGYKRHDFFYVWNGTHYVFTNFGPYDDVDPQIYYNAEEIVAQVQRGVDAGEWLPLLRDMDWQAIARTAVNAGTDGGDGSMTTTEILSAIDRYIDQQGAGMTEGEYLSILSATEGLDGAPAEGYAYTLYKMYTADYGKFGYVILNLLPEARRDAAIDLFRYEWMDHRIPYQDAVPSREEMISRLENAQWESVYALPGGEFTFQSPGGTLLCGAANAYGVYALTFSSSHPEVAIADSSGVVTAVSPGETDVTIHYEGSAGQKDMHVYIRCDWEEAAQTVSTGPSGELINEWQRSFAGFVYSLPAAPDQELIYDGMEENGLEQAILGTLEDYYEAYVAQNGNSDHNDRFSRVLLASPIPDSAEYREEITVSYQVECLSERELDGAAYSLAPQTGDILSTTFTVMEQSVVMGEMLAAGATGTLPWQE